MKRLLLLLPLIAMLSCETPCDIKTDTNYLNQQRDKARAAWQAEENHLEKVKSTIATLDAQIQEKGILATGRVPKYVIRLQVKRERFTTDVNKMMKDEMRAIEFDIPVDKEYYESVREGEVIADHWKNSRITLNMSLGGNTVRVTEKRMY